MRIKTVYIISAKFAPGHFSHMLAYYQLFKQSGYDPYLLVDNEYRDFLSDYPEYHSVILKKGIKIKADMLLIQMMFINILGVVLIGNTRWILSIFSPELLQYCTLFRIISVIFLFAATLGPSTGLMQMTGNESKDNSIRWLSVFVMVLLWIVLRKNPMFALIGMTVQVGLESVLKFGYVCCWFKKSPIHPIRYLVMWIPVAVSSLIAHAISEKSMILSLLLSVFIVLLVSLAVEATDKSMRKKLLAILKRGK